MRFIIQRVQHASVTVDETVLGSIEQGYMVLIGIEQEDTKEIADKMIRKMINLRIFSDEQGKTNLSIQDVQGALLLISQFTLYADCKKGNRPSFIRSGTPEHAKELYEYVLGCCRQTGIQTEQGEFGADMKVELLNDGPFTIILDSREIFA